MIEPYALSKEDPKINNLLTLNYVNQDFWSFKSRMVEHLKQNYEKDFNDITESSYIIMLAEMWAYLADTLSFKIDQLANELFIDTVSEPENALRLAKLVGFKPTPPIPAKAMFIGTLNNPLNEDLRIVSPVRVSFDLHGIGTKYMELFAADPQNNPIFNSEIIIPAGSLSTNSVIGIEGRSRSIHLSSDGTPFLTYVLEGTDILLDSINVTVDGQLWKSVDYFTDLKEEYIIEHNAKYNASIIFGNGVAGRIPPKGSNIIVYYRQGGGTAGNIVTGSIETSVRVSVSGVPYPVIVQFKNYTKGEHGYDGDTIDDIRRKLPLYIRTQNRAVTAADYKSIAELFSSPFDGSIGKAVVALRNHGCAGNIIDLYVLARGPKNSLIKPSENLKEKLALEIDQKKMLTDFVCIRNGEIVYVDITVDMIVSSIYKSSDGALREKISRRMQNLFSLYNLEFGKSLKESDIIRQLTDIKEIESTDITFTTTKGLEAGTGHVNIVTARFNEIVHPDNLIININYK